MTDPTAGPRNPSYWKRTSTAASYPPLTEDGTADAVVVGGGLTGLTTALFLARSGLEVAVLEARKVGEGITGYSTAKLTSLHALTYASLEETRGARASRLYAEANEWALEAMAALVEELDIDCQFERRPALTYARDPDEADAIRAEVEAATRAGLSATHVTEADLPFPIAAGVLVEDQASFHPLRYCLALAAAIERGGSRVHEGTRVVDVEGDRPPLAVRTAGGARLEAPHVVLATGIPFLDRGGYFARVHPSRSYCLALAGANGVPDSMSINTGKPTVSIRPVTGPDGERLVLLAGNEHKVGHAEDTERHYAFLESFGRRYFDSATVAARWSSQDYMPVDDLPLIGRMTGASRPIHVATGFRKWGLTTGTAAARIIDDLIQGRENPWAAFFDAGRSQLPEGLGDALKEGMSDAKRFVGDRVRQLRGESPESLEPGTGAVCRADGDPVAAFRDEEGRLHLLSPVCTHLGCRVVWNRAERSWDCPCHGSRFAVDGSVLDGPAVRPLERH